MARYPLSWPSGWPRTRPERRKQAQFKSYTRRLTVNEAVMRVLEQLRLLRVTDEVLISSNLRTRLDGKPRSDQPEPEDPGVAVYWVQQGGEKVMAIDIYDRVADNLAAVAASLEALRAIERHGGATVRDQAFQGFTALPAPKSWREVLGVGEGESFEIVRQKYRRLVAVHHPDRGGSHERMAEITAAYTEAEKELQ